MYEWVRRHGVPPRGEGLQQLVDTVGQRRDRCVGESSEGVGNRPAQRPRAGPAAHGLGWAVHRDDHVCGKQHLIDQRAGVGAAELQPPARSRDHQVGPLGEQMAQAVVLGGHLLGGIEDPGHVHSRLCDLGGQVEHHGQAALHVGRPEPVQGVALDPRRRVVVGRHGVEVAGHDEPHGPAQVGPGDDVFADPIDPEVAHRPEPGHHVIGQGLLLVAHRRDRHQFRHASQQIGHPGQVTSRAGGPVSPFPWAAARAYRERP